MQPLAQIDTAEGPGAELVNDRKPDGIGEGAKSDELFERGSLFGNGRSHPS